MEEQVIQLLFRELQQHIQLAVVAKYHQHHFQMGLGQIILAKAAAPLVPQINLAGLAVQVL
jgi:hypothetical protein